MRIIVDATRAIDFHHQTPLSLLSGPRSERPTSRIYRDLFSTRTVSHAKTVSAYGTMANQKSRQFDSVSPPHIGIVGAGLAGLRCADILLGHGFNVTILEGRDRVGGRVRQVQLPNSHWVDLGPNWIHGTEDNPILDLAKETNTVYGDWDTDTNVFDEDGSLFSEEEGDKYATLTWDIIQEAFKYSNQHCQDIDPQKSLLDFFNTKVVDKLPDTEPHFEQKRKIMLQMCEMWGAFVGSAVSTQSLKYFWLEECIDGENLFCAGTYKKILQHVAKPALDQATIIYNTTVTKICSASTSDKVAITTQDGKSYEFDEIVGTMPLGWLKQHKDVFEPALPQPLSKSIDAIGYGCLEKVYVSFAEAFWRNSDNTDENVNGFMQWISPTYANDSNPAQWHQEAVELASIDETVAHPTLLFYIFGDQSRLITSTLATLKTQQERNGYLYNFFKPYYSRLPRYDETAPSCKLTGCLATNWLQDDLAGNGSYSNFQSGLENGDEAIRVMREGMPDVGVWLAGEHTAPFVALGTATGAYWSGENVAKRVAGAYGLKQHNE